MILVAESGSTKTTWALLDKGDSRSHLFTEGINPYFQTSDKILELLKRFFSEYQGSTESVHFYGAGCTEEKIPIVEKAIKQFFKGAYVEVKSDLWAAARALGKNSECIIGILGTGSNSCYYNGKEIVKNVSPLGYILGDEGSGAVMGRKLLSDVLKHQLDIETIAKFNKVYKLSSAEIIERVYRQIYPNRFMASFAPFLKENIDNIKIKNIVLESFREYVERNLMQYEKVNKLPIHFTGSIAFIFQNILEEVFEEYGLHLGSICKQPIDGLVNFHKTQK